MKTLTDHLAQYAAYHRDPRNISTHVVGVPMILLAVVTLLSVPVAMVGVVPVSAATPVTVAACIFYLRLDRRFGVAMTLLLLLTMLVAHWLAGLSTANWLWTGMGLFVLGWAIQFLGHYFEGKKPAFVDDLMGLLIAPLFLVAEAAFLFNMRLEEKAAIELRVGTVHRRKPAVAA
ncbi:MAG: hypothetical protein RIS34_783 [Pseudomonadota bacterium]|jgi:uncharacterized membrane protein YGL010W